MLLATGLAAVSVMVIFCSNSAGRIKKHRLRIAAGPAPVSLEEFTRQTRLQLLFEFDAVRASITHEVNGEFDADEALRLMLDGSGLAYFFVNDRTVSVRPVTAPAGR